MPFGKPGSTISEKIHIHGASLSEQQTVGLPTNLSWYTTGFGTVTRA